MIKDNLKAAIRRNLIKEKDKGENYSEIAGMINQPGVTKDVIRHICKGDNTTDDKWTAIFNALFDRTLDNDISDEPFNTEVDAIETETAVAVNDEKQLVFVDIAPMKDHLTVGVNKQASNCLEYIKQHTDKTYKDIVSDLIVYASKHITWKQQGANDGAE